MKILSLVVILAFTGCSALTPQNPNATTIAGAGSLIEDKSPLLSSNSANFSVIDYCSLLQDYGFSTGERGENGCKLTVSKIALSDDDLALRDDLQDRLIAASVQKCNQYVNFLQETKADTDILWGGISTLLSGAGAVLTHAPTAQVFAAGGAVTSGIRAEINQAYFANLAVEVMTSGIQSRRNRIMEEILERRTNHKTTYYSLSGAIADALKFHAACNAVTGFEVAAQSISRADNPGAAELKRFADDLNDLNISISRPGTSATTTLATPAESTIQAPAQVTPNEAEQVELQQEEVGPSVLLQVR